ncbi:MAG: hypothetical protein BGO12_06780 [Verrucomicrobia bacterium 61-8]|nr:aldose epimerase [Verrucomicrobiota bacterium]OJV14144.1 MAG: hypothetical protein BGO12_06780 [Verrucomicrobia bacterium 61-8]
MLTSDIDQKSRLWNIGDSVFEAAPETGARLMRWRYRGREVLHWPNDAASDEIAEVWGGNPILFPFPARCFVEGEPYRWISPDGISRPMPMHGIARQGTFLVTAESRTAFTATFQPEQEARQAYPFLYTFSVTYHFSANGFTCDLVLENNDTQAIPWCAGHHFFFALPLVPGLSRSEHSLSIDADRACVAGLSTKGRIVDRAPFKSPVTLDEPGLADAVIHCALRSHEAVLNSETGSMSIVVRHQRSVLADAHAAFVTWSPADAPFYCVEPWMGPSNATEHGHGLHYVAPGERAAFSVEVEARLSAPDPSEDARTSRPRAGI